jgi:hypothetical protein
MSASWVVVTVVAAIVAITVLVSGMEGGVRVAWVSFNVLVAIIATTALVGALEEARLRLDRWRWKHRQ